MIAAGNRWLIKRFSFLHRDILRDYLANVTALFSLLIVGSQFVQPDTLSDSLPRYLHLSRPPHQSRFAHEPKTSRLRFEKGGLEILCNF
ncbi:hypothetical protein QF000_007945 [Paraburkholderia atlantica]